VTCDARSVIGSSAGAAERHRRSAALDIARELAEGRINVDDASYGMGRLVEQGLDLSDAGDLLQGSAARAGLTADLGTDGVQSAIAGGIAEGRRAAAEEAESEAMHDAAEAAAAATTGAADARPWPVLSKAAMRGLAGDFARVATKRSEADPVAVMMTAMTGIGALLGRARCIRVGDTEHHPRLMCALVGATARARKGTSWGPVRRLLRRTEEIIHDTSTLPHPLGLRLQITHGPLSSAEGLVAVIRDRMGEEDEGGTDDKRLLVVEGEFGSALRAMQRPGNMLNMMLRTAWDGLDLAPLIKNNRTIASDPHICIMAHITRQELRDLMSASDVWGGLANRLLWACVRRRHLVPLPKGVNTDDLDRIAAELARVAIHANEHAGELRLSNAAQDHWAAVYPELTQDHPGLLGAATARAEAQTIRLALTYAMIDGADRIEIEHLEAGLAMWRYAEDSAGYLFGGAEMNPVAQTILTLLAKGPRTQTDISNTFGRHMKAAELNSVLTDMQERGRITATREPGAGRPRLVWSLAA
jgi:hypothetical protein